MGGGSSSTKDSAQWGFRSGYQQTTPWDVQTPYLKQTFDEAQKEYEEQKAKGPYAGDYLAPSTQTQKDAVGAVLAGADASQGYNDELLKSSQGAMGSGLDWMKSAAGAMGGLTGNQTMGNIERAGQYVGGLDLDALTKAGMAAGVRTASEQALPTIYRGGAAGGNINSDRVALSDGVVRRGLAEGAQNLRSTLGADAYKWGVGQAASDLAQQLQAAGALGSLGSGAYGQGQAGIGSGVNAQGMIDARRMEAGDYDWRARNNDTQNALMKGLNEQNFGWQNLQNLYNIIGNKSWGQNQVYGEVSGQKGTETTTRNPSLMESIGSGVGVLSGLTSGTGGGILGGLFNTGRNLFK